MIDNGKTKNDINNVMCTLETFEHSSFQQEIYNELKSFMTKAHKELEVYNESWLFGDDAWHMKSFSLTT